MSRRDRPRTWRRPFQSLSARIVLAALTASLVTSLVVTAISAQSTESFLRVEIDRRFPEMLRQAAQRLEIWYSQRELEIQTFAGSATLVEGLRASAADPAGSGEAGRNEVGTYLGYVLERFPQFEALFVLHADGGPYAWVGNELALPPELRRDLAALRGPRVSDVHELEGRAVQIASAPVRDERGRRIASLHALLEGDSLEAVLANDELTVGGIYVVDARGSVLLSSPDAAPRQRLARRPPAEGVGVAVERYESAGGEPMVGAVRRFERFGWALLVEEPYAEAFAPVLALVRRTLAIELAAVALFSLIALQVARSIVRPVVALSAEARRIAAGEGDVHIPDSDRRDEIGVLTRAIHEMTSRLQRNQRELEDKRREIEQANTRLAAHNQQLQQVNEVLEQLSITDGLTRLHNHRFFQDHLPREVKRAARTGEPMSLLLIDIDDFKALNDRYGHAAGDVVLRSTAEVMSGVVREMDLLARYGGEEFALLATQASLEGALVLAEKVREAVETNSIEIDDGEGARPVRITVSIGVSEFKGDRKMLFQEADRALYEAKRAGKNRVVAADAEGAA